MIDIGKFVPRQGLQHGLRLIRGEPAPRGVSHASFSISTPAERRASLAIALAIHGGLLSALMAGLAAPPPVPGQKAREMTLIDLGNGIPAGSPDGHSTQPSPASQLRSDPITPQRAEQPEEPPADLAEPTPPVEPNIHSPEQPRSEPVSSRLPDTASSEADDTGSLAMGARIHGDHAGLDGNLAAAVGSAIATRIKACWDAPPAGLPGALAITMTVTFDPEGALMGTPIITRLVQETRTVVTEPSAYEQAAISAVERCSPLQLPKHLYAYWQRVDIEIFSARPVEASRTNQPVIAAGPDGGSAFLGPA